MKPKIAVIKIAQTGVLLALLVVLQGVTAGLGNQFLTGSLVNLVLAIAALVGGLLPGLVVALVSPFVAFLFGIGPKLLLIVPLIAIGNAALVLVLYFAAGKSSRSVRLVGAAIGAAVCKFLVLYLLVVQIVCRFAGLAQGQVATFSAMFSWPQLVTALIGGFLACAIVPLLRRALPKVQA